MTLARPDGSRKVIRYDDLSTGDWASSSLRSALEGLKGIFLSPLAPPSRFAPDLLPPGTLLRRMDGHVFRVAAPRAGDRIRRDRGRQRAVLAVGQDRRAALPVRAARAAAMSAGRRAPVVRVLGGRWKGRRLEASAAARPTSGRARQALVNLLGDRVQGARVLDLYAGTGAVGIELVSRGAASAVLVERGVGAFAPRARADRRRAGGGPDGRRPGRPGRGGSRRGRGSASTSCSPIRPTARAPLSATLAQAAGLLSDRGVLALQVDAETPVPSAAGPRPARAAGLRP